LGITPETRANSRLILRQDSMVLDSYFRKSSQRIGLASHEGLDRFSRAVDFGICGWSWRDFVGLAWLNFGHDYRKIYTNILKKHFTFSS
jgi:hypothetical protein